MGQLLDWTQHSTVPGVSYNLPANWSIRMLQLRIEGEERRGGEGGIRLKAAYTFGATCCKQLSSPFRHKQFTIKSSRGNNAIARVETVTFWDRIGFCRGEKGREGRGVREERAERRERRDRETSNWASYMQANLLFMNLGSLHKVWQLTHTHTRGRVARRRHVKKWMCCFNYKDSAYLPLPFHLPPFHWEWNLQ